MGSEEEGQEWNKETCKADTSHMISKHRTMSQGSDPVFVLPGEHRLIHPVLGHKRALLIDWR